MSQLLENKRQKMTQQQDSDSESSSDEDSDEDSDENDNSPSTAGVIERIVLKNFMCHDSFELNLGPQLNFIIGRNGSGKSAILTGISVGLGAKASDTSRGSSIKSLIKDDKNTARVTITLSNMGEDAYEPEKFGSKIIVERKLQRIGSNSYSIKGADGRTISSKKNVLDEILHKFNITVDNPMAFLSQDKAREFLTTTTDQNKYDYFMAGSSIEDILDKYTLTSKNIQQVRNKLKLTRTHFEVATKKYEEAAAVYNQLKKSDNLRKQLQLLNGKMYWYNVQVYEKKINSYSQRIEQLNSEISELKNQEATTGQEVVIRGNERVKHVEAIENAAAEVTQWDEKIARENEELTELRANVSQLEDDMRDGKNEILANEQEIKECEHKIKLEQDRINKQQGGSKEILAQKLEEYERRKQELQEEDKDVSAQYDSLNNSMNTSTKSPEMREIAEQIANLDTSMESNRRYKQSLLSSQKDRYAPWGPNTHVLLKEIRNTSGWHKPPLGPIGSFVSIKQEYSKWHDLVNTVYSKSLDSYLVCDEHDRRILANILKRMRIHKNIIVRKYERYDYLSGKATGHLSVADVINVKNMDVFFTLIDTNNMEREVLYQDEEKAKDAVRDTKVANSYFLFDSRGANRYSGNSGNLKLDPVIYNKNGDKLSRGQQVTAEEISRIDQQIEKDQKERHALVRKSRDLKMKEDYAREERRKALAIQIRTIGKEVNILEAKIFKINDQLKDDGDEGKITAFEEKIEECKDLISKKKEIMQGVQSELVKLKAEYDQQRRKMQKYTKSRNIAIAAEEDSKEFLKEFDIQGAQLSSNLDHYRISIAKREKAIEDIEDKKRTTEEKRDELKVEAQEKCSREEVPITENDSRESITNEYVYVQNAVAEAEKNMGRSYQEIQQELLSSKQLKDSLEETLSDLDKTERTLDDDLANRFSYMNTTINKSINEATASFEESLALRGFTGELKFGFGDKTLTMLVKTPGDKQMRTVESLSGGEKSFTQIALLLAIWRVMDSRIRGLDEFDVFMDSINRTISIRLLLSQLRMYPKSQSIFITPQDITNVKDLDRPDVKIHQMHSPRND